MQTRLAIQRIFFFVVWIIVYAGVSDAQSPPLLKARLKIEGVHKKTAVRAVDQALLSIPGVKKVEWKIPKRWFFFRDYKKGHVIVEFEQGTLTSETLIRAIEAISKPKNIYKVKFLE